jgi:Urocanase C-terminal domain
MAVREAEIFFLNFQIEFLNPSDATLTGGVGWGEVINGGFGLLLDGSEDAERRAKCMLNWDVNNGVRSLKSPLAIEFSHSILSPTDFSTVVGGKFERTGDNQTSHESGTETAGHFTKFRGRRCVVRNFKKNSRLNKRFYKFSSHLH